MNIQEALKGVYDVTDTFDISVGIRKGYATKLPFSEAQVIIANLIELGGAVTGTNNIHSDDYCTTVEFPTFSIDVWFTRKKSKEEECAELKARLAELGCHY